MTKEPMAAGVWRLRFGVPEAATPTTIIKPLIDARRRVDTGPAADWPFDPERVTAERTARGFVVRLPLEPGEDVYGLGLQLKSHRQTGLKKTLRVNSDPVADTGDSHAPVPFLASTRGYGVLVDTLRYATFYCGSHARNAGAAAAGTAAIGLSTEALYAARDIARREGVIEVPAAAGVDLYVFAGPTLRDAVCRYNRFSGGGCLPPLWGLGNWYRAKADAADSDVERLVEALERDGIPVDVIGLEPGWQTAAYSCSYVWEPKRFPDPGRFVAGMAARHKQVNLWEHVYVHPSSPVHAGLASLSGDDLVWNGLVPDLSLEPARGIFGGHQDRELLDAGVSGFKLDECDNSDFIRTPWCFPETSRFPSGLDGEQMHSALGLLYQETMLALFRRRHRRSFHEVRSSHALAASYPFALYSDLYDHGDFIRGVVNAGFSGLLWSPEVREATSVRDLVRRLQTTVFSPLSQVNGWYLSHPPWFQMDRDRNNAGEAMPGTLEATALCREALQLRMALVPYLYAAFARYYFEGLPPFRALVMDYPQDAASRAVDSQFLVGDALMVAPLTAASDTRAVYLPPGGWYGFWDEERYEGGRTLTGTWPLDRLPVFVKEHAILPLALGRTFHGAAPCYELEARCYGSRGGDFALLDDDGASLDIERGHYSRPLLRDDGTDIRLHHGSQHDYGRYVLKSVRRIGAQGRRGPDRL